MRPQGDVRAELRKALKRLAAEHGAATHRQVAHAAQVGLRPARWTLDNMARAGEIERVGSAKAAGSRHWCTLYAPLQQAEPAATASSGPELLADAMRGFVGGAAREGR